MRVATFAELEDISLLLCILCNCSINNIAALLALTEL